MKDIALYGGLVIVLMVLLAMQPGCTSLTQTPAEHMHSYERVFWHDVHLMPDDIDVLLELERPTRLSRWVVTY